MRIKLGIYWQENTAYLLNIVKKQVEAIFPGLNCISIFPLEPPTNCWDSFRHHYDVHCLLDFCKLPEEYDLTLWLLHVNIGSSRYSGLFGAAGQGKAIVSAAYLIGEQDVGKEACHEIGHLLGLAHCSNDCLMRPSYTSQEAENKAAKLCIFCQKILTAKCSDFEKEKSKSYFKKKEVKQKDQ